MFRLALEAARPMACESRDGVLRYLTLNVSPRLFQHTDFDKRLLDLVDEIGFDPARAAPGSDRRHAARRSGERGGDAASPGERGIEAALDDFGTGYSSLGHVHQFPLKMIKIDQSFVAPFANGVPPRSSALIEAILALGNALGTEIVAEGVETDAQWAVLRAMGCVYGQGYRFARPAPADHWLGQ